MAEANEPPLDCARREVKEELDLEYRGGRPLIIDWVTPHGPSDDSLMFIFDGGVLGEAQQGRITLRDGELSEYRFCAPDEASRLLRPYIWHRVKAALDALADQETAYLHDGSSWTTQPVDLTVREAIADVWGTDPGARGSRRIPTTRRGDLQRGGRIY